MAGEASRHLPILVDLAGKRIVVVGGGAVAERKVRALLDCGAEVTVVAPRLTEGLSEMASAERVAHEARGYREGDLEGATLAFVAVDDPEASRRAADDARRAGVPVNVVDRPDLCDFIVPSVLRRGRLAVAVSTGGASPAWARKLRERLEAQLGDEYARLLEGLARARCRVMDEVADPAERRRALERLADDSLLEAARKGSAEDVGARALELALAGLEST
jgi:precorrin-2 dehydrogenase/sirohydrochlorin ferrochelatase